MIKRFTLATLALFLTVLATGCNTMEGIGQDIKKGGQALEKAASDNK